MNKRHLYRGIIFVAIVLALGAIFVAPVQAASINNNGSVAAGQTVDDDLIIGAQTIQIDGTVNGNVVAMGSTITITGTINGDLIAFAKSVTLAPGAVVTNNLFTVAQIITVNGKISGSLFAGGEAAALGANSTVGDNAYFGGYSFTSQSGSVITKDLRAEAYQAVLNGTIGQNAVINAGAVELNGKFGHNVELWLYDTKNSNPGAYMAQDIVPAAAPGLHVDPAAQIAGKLIYTSPQKYDIGIVPGGGIEYLIPATPETHKTAFGPALVSRETGNGLKPWHALSSLITLLLVGALLLGVFSKPFMKTVEAAHRRTLVSAGIGLLVIALAIPAFIIAACVIVLAGILLSIISLGGLTNLIFGLGLGALGLAASALLVLVTIVSKVIFAYLVGNLILNAFKANVTGVWQNPLPLLIGVVIYAVLASVPFIGWLVSVIASFIGVGAVWSWLFPAKPVVQSQPELPLNQ